MAKRTKSRVKRFLAVILSAAVVMTALPQAALAKVWDTPTVPELPAVNYYSSPISEGSEYHQYSIKYSANLSVPSSGTTQEFTITPPANGVLNGRDVVSIKGTGTAVLEARLHGE